MEAQRDGLQRCTDKQLFSTVVIRDVVYPEVPTLTINDSDRVRGTAWLLVGPDSHTHLRALCGAGLAGPSPRTGRTYRS